jgi:hypothetical protein
MTGYMMMMGLSMGEGLGGWQGEGYPLVLKWTARYNKSNTWSLIEPFVTGSVCGVVTTNEILASTRVRVVGPA